MTDRKKPGVAFWATVAVVVALVAYPLSFGPACWITSRLDRGADLVPVLYRPLTWAMAADEKALITRVCTRYAKIGAPEDWEWGPVWDSDFSAEPVGWWWGSTGLYVTPPPAMLLPPSPSSPPYTSSPTLVEPDD